MADVKDLTVEEKLKALYSLQSIDVQLDDFERLKGELPIEVKDLEDEIEGLRLRIAKIEQEIADKTTNIDNQKQGMKNAEMIRVKYEEQQMNVKNNREYEALSKEIELQKLEHQLCQKRIGEAERYIEEKNEMIKETKDKIKIRETELKEKQVELKKIIAETDKEEKELKKKSEKAKDTLEDRLKKAYTHIRKSYRNGMAVVKVDRNACGGCFNEIPPQLQVEIGQRKKIIVCENCGRILVDTEIDATEDSKKEEQIEVKEVKVSKAKKVSKKESKK
jgi:uncharacterized protein